MKVGTEIKELLGAVKRELEGFVNRMEGYMERFRELCRENRDECAEEFTRFLNELGQHSNPLLRALASAVLMQVSIYVAQQRAVDRAAM